MTEQTHGPRRTGGAGAQRNFSRRCRPLLLIALFAAVVVGITWFAAPAGAQTDTCVGDCDENHHVTITDLLRDVRIALGRSDTTQCALADPQC